MKENEEKQKGGERSVCGGEKKKGASILGVLMVKSL